MQSSSKFQDNTWALVTPSYSYDLERCELLVESAQINNSSSKHYLIIDKRDTKFFKHLQSKNVQIITSEDLIDIWTYRLPFKKSVWLHGYLKLTRGWIMQQIFKIGISGFLSEDILIYCDSDMFFIRPFGIETVTTDGKIDLLDLPFNIGMGPKWTGVSAELLGIPKNQLEVRGYVGNMIAWRRQNVRDMQSHIEIVGRRCWNEEIVRHMTFSEYTLYGNYIRSVIGYENSGHISSQKSIIAHSWGKEISSLSLLEHLFHDVKNTEVGMMIHSKTPVNIGDVRNLAKKFWRQN